jgi:tape measure domain-containing protein
VVVRDLITLLGFKLEDGPQKQYDRQIDQTKEKSNSLAKMARGIGTAYKIAAGLAVAAVGWISKNVIEATVGIEAYRTQMETFTGSAEAAAEALANLRDKKVDALFGTGTLVNSYKQLRMIGMGAEDTSRMIDVLGDCANGSAENFNALSNVLTKVSTTGKVNEGTLRQLANAGFGVQDMAQGLGMTTDQLNAKIAAGKIGFNELTKAMEGATAEGGRFFGNAEKQANTLGGALKVLKSTISGIGDAIGTGVIPKLVGLIRYITDLIKLGQSGLAKFGQNAFEYLIHVIYQVIIFFEVLQMRMKRFGGAFTPIKALIGDVFDFFKSVVQSAAPYWMAMAQLILVAFKPIQAFVKPVLEALKPIIQSVFGFMAKKVEKLIPIVDGLTPVFKQLGEFIGLIIGPILKVAAAFKIVSIAVGIFNAIATVSPFTWIIIGIIALVAAIVLLVKNFSKITDWFKNKFPNTYKVITDFIEFLKPIVLAIVNIFKAVVSAVKGILSGILGVVKAIFGAVFGIIKNTFGAIFDTIAGIFDGIVGIWSGSGNIFQKIFETVKLVITKVLEGIKRIFIGNFEYILNVIKSFGRLFQNIFEGIGGIVFAVVNYIKAIWQAVWDKITGIFKNFIEDTKADWNEFVGFIAALWEGIKNIALSIWNGIKDIFFGVVESVKNIWNGLISFFTGLWEAFKQGPSEALEYIKNAFFGLFDMIREKFFGFIDVIRGGFEKVKTFFGGIGKGVVNFFTGGDSGGGTERESSGSRSSEAPIGGLAMAAATSAASNYHTYNTAGSSNTVNANSQITVNVPAGTSAEQAQAISRQVDQAMQNYWASAIGGARSSIPSPEARRR